MAIKRSEILFLYDNVDNNPNGDPVDSNKPRIDEETGINLVTDVRLKRTIRDFLHDYKNHEIFIKEIRDDKDKVQDGKTRAKAFGSKKDEISKNVREKCIDVRLFGATIPLDKNSITFTGPVQFNMGRSLHKVQLKTVKGTGAFASGEGKANKSFREEYIVPYSLVGFYGIINEHAAEKTDLKEEDIDLLLEGMWNGTKNLISRSKIGQMPRVLIKINYKEHNYHIGGLLNKLTLDKSIDDEAIRSSKDYSIELNELTKVVFNNKEKIQTIDYVIDSDIKFCLNGESIEFRNAFNGIELNELKY